MTDAKALYRELKGTLETIAGALLDFATDQVVKRGAFLPFGATLSPDGEIALHAAAPAQDLATSDDVMPLLEMALQRAVVQAPSEAAAVCNWVKIGTDDGQFRDAVKVHVHHRRGLAVAFYLPATKAPDDGWEFDEMIVQAADGLIEGWPPLGAA